MENKPKIQEISEKAKAVAEAMLLKKAEGIVRIARDGNEWNVAVEVLDRKAVPDTRDILSIYAMKFDLEGDLLSYNRIAVHHRGDMEQVEEEE
ncbi:MAG TPA: gas vesicle protein GvpO [Methanotrichaceae archaeon]|nr:gas vesicle protein GvpO [Methanotrichaceae archaeon]